MIDAFQLPTPPPQPADNSYRAFVQWILGYGDKIYTYVNSWTGRLSKQFNTLFNGYGPDIASAATITVANAVHQVTGSVSIATINQPAGQSAVSAVTLYAKDGFSLLSSGNISLPTLGSGSHPFVVAKGGSITLEYHPVLKKWVGAPSLLVPFSQVVVLSTSVNSPYAVPSGNVLLLIDTTSADFIANLSATPAVDDAVTVKRTAGSFHIVLTPAAGMTIDGNATQPVPGTGIQNAASIVYGETNQWFVYSSY